MAVVQAMVAVVSESKARRTPVSTAALLTVRRIIEGRSRAYRQGAIMAGFAAVIPVFADVAAAVVVPLVATGFARITPVFPEIRATRRVKAPLAGERRGRT